MKAHSAQEEKVVSDMVAYYLRPESEGGLAAEVFAEFLDAAPFVEENPRLRELIDTEDYSSFKDIILSDLKLKEDAEDYIRDAGDFSDFF